MRMPIVVERLLPLQNLNLPVDPNQEFDFKFLKTFLGGSPAAEGFYVIPSARAGGIAGGIRSYKALASTCNPLLPQSPGQHEAQISCISHTHEDAWGPRETLQPFALFIRGPGSGYKYFGHYREPSPADHLGRDEILRMPNHIKQSWAQRLGAKSRTGGSKQWRYLHSLRAFWEERFNCVALFQSSSSEMIDHDSDLENDEDVAVVGRTITIEEADNLRTSQILKAFGTVMANSLIEMWS
jgi:hypothetical protein